MYWEHKLIYHKKEKIYLENDIKAYIMNKYDLKSYVKDGTLNPVDLIIKNHYKISK